MHVMHCVAAAIGVGFDVMLPRPWFSRLWARFFLQWVAAFSELVLL